MTKTRLIGITLLLLTASAALDRFFSEHVSLGVLYVLPMLPAALFLNRWQIVVFGLVLAVIRSMIAAFPAAADGALRFLMGWVAYSGTGLFVGELTHRRRLEQEHHAELAEQGRLRREAEEHLRVLASSSPAAILTLDSDARILSANEAAGELLGFPPPLNLTGINVTKYLPVLADALKLDSGAHRFRTALQGTGQRESGDLFVAQIWFSTYQTPDGRRLAAIAVDCSEETREREEENLRRLQENNRIVASAVSHEIRNICGAIGLVHSNLVRSGMLGDGDDARALASLVSGLERIAAAELEQRSQRPVGLIDVREVLGQLRIVIEPGWTEMGGHVYWQIPPNLPPAYGDSFGLLQALLNLAQNSVRAVEKGVRRELILSAQVNGDRLQISLEDSGPGVPSDRPLFQPFQSGAEHVGLGLFISRAMLRSYGGDLRHEPRANGARFVAELQLAAAAANRVAS
jgi:PAS domain S-box-containing protein